MPPSPPDPQEAALFWESIKDLEIDDWTRRIFEQAFQAGQQRLLLRMLRKRFGRLVDHNVEWRLAGVPSAQLEIWAVRRHRPPR